MQSATQPKSDFRQISRAGRFAHLWKGLHLMGMSEYRRELCEVAVEHVVDFGADRASTILLLGRGLPARDNVVSIHLKNRNRKSQKIKQPVTHPSMVLNVSQLVSSCIFQMLSTAQDHLRKNHKFAGTLHQVKKQVTKPQG